MPNSLNDDKKLSTVLEWLLPLTSSENGNFELDSNQYSAKEWMRKKEDLHLVWCKQLIEYRYLTDNDHILGRFKTENLKNKGVCIDV